MYTHQVNYSKVFVAGMLAGKVYHDHLRFASMADAKAFAAKSGQILKACAGEGDYRLEDMSIINLAQFA